MNDLAIIGAGTMGTGIAQLTATRGCTVRLIDVNKDVAEIALASIRKRLDRSVEKGRISEAQREAIMGRIQIQKAIEDLGDVDLAIEAVVENMDIKHKVFSALERATSDSAVLASNTSSLSISKIADAVRDPSRVIGMHFFNPAPIMPLVEIVAGDKSDSAAVDKAYEATKAWGKTPVRVKDTPGFIVNRVARGFYLESLRLLDEGVSGVDEIDCIMRAFGGFKMGPFELMDLIGIDVNYAVTTSVFEQMGKPARLAPHEIQRKLVEAGHIGRKAGRGFYLYDAPVRVASFPVDRKNFDLSPLLRDAMRNFCTRAGVIDAGTTEQYVLSRVLAAIMNEAGRAYGDQIATSDDIDTAMIRGTNYPKGPLAWADEIGHRNVRGLLKSLNEQTTDRRYDPAPLYANAL